MCICDWCVSRPEITRSSVSNPCGGVCTKIHEVYIGSSNKFAVGYGGYCSNHMQPPTGFETGTEIWERDICRVGTMTFDDRNKPLKRKSEAQYNDGGCSIRYGAIWSVRCTTGMFGEGWIDGRVIATKKKKKKKEKRIMDKQDLKIYWFGTSICRSSRSATRKYLLWHSRF